MYQLITDNNLPIILCTSWRTHDWKSNFGKPPEMYKLAWPSPAEKMVGKKTGQQYSTLHLLCLYPAPGNQPLLWLIYSVEPGDNTRLLLSCSHWICHVIMWVFSRVQVSCACLYNYRGFLHYYWHINQTFRRFWCISLLCNSVITNCSVIVVLVWLARCEYTVYLCKQMF